MQITSGVSTDAIRSRDPVASKLEQQNAQLLEENNLLKLKIELLLDMLTASNADFTAQSKELQAYRKTHS